MREQSWGFPSRPCRSILQILNTANRLRRGQERASRIQPLFKPLPLKQSMLMSLLGKISGSGPLGPDPASQRVCSATLPGSLPAFCSVITYRLGAGEADGQDVNTQKQTQTTLPVDPAREKPLWKTEKMREKDLKCSTTLNPPHASAEIKLRVRDESDKADTELELRETEVPCWRLRLPLSPLSHPLLTFYPGASQRASCCHSGMPAYLAKKVKNLSHLHKKHC